MWPWVKVGASKSGLDSVPLPIGGLASERGGRRPPRYIEISLPRRGGCGGGEGDAAYHRPAGFSGAELAAQARNVEERKERVALRGHETLGYHRLLASLFPKR
jgi:hypothetical protein